MLAPPRGWPGPAPGPQGGGKARQAGSLPPGVEGAARPRASLCPPLPCPFPRTTTNPTPPRPHPSSSPSPPPADIYHRTTAAITVGTHLLRGHPHGEQVGGCQAPALHRLGRGKLLGEAGEDAPAQPGADGLQQLRARAREMAVGATRRRRGAQRKPIRAQACKPASQGRTGNAPHAPFQTTARKAAMRAWPHNGTQGLRRALPPHLQLGQHVAPQRERLRPRLSLTQRSKGALGASLHLPPLAQLVLHRRRRAAERGFARQHRAAQITGTTLAASSGMNPWCTTTWSALATCALQTRGHFTCSPAWHREGTWRKRYSTTSASSSTSEGSSTSRRCAASCCTASAGVAGPWTSCVAWRCAARATAAVEFAAAAHGQRRRRLPPTAHACHRQLLP